MKVDLPSNHYHSLPSPTLPLPRPTPPLHTSTTRAAMRVPSVLLSALGLATAALAAPSQVSDPRVCGPRNSEFLDPAIDALIQGKVVELLAGVGDVVGGVVGGLLGKRATKNVQGEYNSSRPTFVELCLGEGYNHLLIMLWLR